jgi:uncharacterized protein
MKFLKSHTFAVVVLVLAAVVTCGVAWVRLSGGAPPPATTQTVQPVQTPGGTTQAPVSPAESQEITDTSDVRDGAGVLSAETEQMIRTVNRELKSKTGGEIVIVSVASLHGAPADQLAQSLFDDYFAGSGGKNNGMLLLFSPFEGKGWLLQGAAITKDFSDDRINQYLDTYFWDAFDEGQYDAAVQELFGALTGWYETHYGVTISSSQWDGDTIGGHWQSLFLFGGRLVGRALVAVIVIVCVLAFGVIFLVWALFSGRRRSRPYGPGGFYTSFWRGRTWRRPPPPGPGPFPGGGGRPPRGTDYTRSSSRGGGRTGGSGGGRSSSGGSGGGGRSGSSGGGRR